MLRSCMDYSRFYRLLVGKVRTNVDGGDPVLNIWLRGLAKNHVYEPSPLRGADLHNVQSFHPALALNMAAELLRRGEFSVRLTSRRVGFIRVRKNTVQV